MKEKKCSEVLIGLEERSSKALGVTCDLKVFERRIVASGGKWSWPTLYNSADINRGEGIILVSHGKLTVWMVLSLIFKSIS